MNTYKIIPLEKTQYCEEKCTKIIDFFYNFNDVSTPTNISPDNIINSCKNYCIKTTPDTQIDYSKTITLAEEMGLIIAEEYNATKINQQQKD